MPDALLQLAEFIATVDRHVVAEVAFGNAACGAKDLPQWYRNLPGDPPGGQRAQGQGGHCHAHQQCAGVVCLAVALGVLALAQLVTVVAQVIELLFEAVLHGLHVELGFLELDQLLAIVSQVGLEQC